LRRRKSTAPALFIPKPVMPAMFSSSQLYCPCGTQALMIWLVSLKLYCLWGNDRVVNFLANKGIAK
jgi:hypothetical protein